MEESPSRFAVQTKDGLASSFINAADSQAVEFNEMRHVWKVR